MPRRKKELAMRLLSAIVLYSNYKVCSRGPEGILLDVIEELDPKLRKSVEKHGAHSTYRRRGGFDE